MAETLLSGSSILMYGRVMTDITLSQTGHPEPPLGASHNLQDQLAVTGAQLARIYAFSYGGDFYTLAAPVIFLVDGSGTPYLGAAGSTGGGFRAPAGADDTGVAAQNYDFSEDMVFWTYEKNDISLRLDLSTGMLEDILLEAELGDDMDFPSFGGGKVGGGKVGGGKVGGGKVGGGKVGGGKVGGGKVGGGKVGGG